MLLDLPINRRSGYVLRGYREDLALHLGRSPAALSVRRRELLRQRLEAARSIL